jgi:uncharacterized protein (DUF1800 family)
MSAVSAAEPQAAPVTVEAEADAATEILLAGTDSDGDALIYEFDAVSVAGGTVTAGAATDRVLYAPPNGYLGADSFSYRADDGTSTSAPATVTITVLAPNRPPVAESQALSTTETVATAITLIATDPDDDLLTYTLGLPAHGLLEGVAPDLTYTPATGFVGTDSFDFSVSDGVLASETATVSILVNSGAPVANSQTVSTMPDTPVSVVLSGSDPTDDPLSFVFQQPAHGTLSGAAPDLVYLPAPGFEGQDEFSFVAFDGQNSSAPGIISITVMPDNRPPSALSQRLAVVSDSSVDVQLSGTDPDGDALTYEIVSEPANGAISGTAPLLTYTPAPGYQGTDELSFRVSDPDLVASEVATITFVISADNSDVFCGDPRVHPPTDVGLFLWRSCDVQPALWHLRVSGGTTPGRLEYTGNFAGGDISGLVPELLEPNDVVERVGDDLDYRLIVYAGAQDGLRFSATGGACFTPSMPPSVPVFLGAGRTVLASQDVRLATGLPCVDEPDSDGDGLSDSQELLLGTDPELADTDGGGVDDGSEVNSGRDPLNPADDGFRQSDFCGDPQIQVAVQTGTFLWRDCAGSGRWQLRVSGGATASRLDYAGRVSGVSGAVSPVLLEPNDTLDQSDPNQVSYNLIVYAGAQDGFSFSAAGDSCFTPNLPAGVPVYLGGNQLPLLGSDLSLQTGLPCGVAFVDTDDDGLSDDQESALGTDPNVPDTDGGGVLDGAEVAANTDPLDPTDDQLPVTDLCGVPDFDHGIDQGTFLWSDCGAPATWNLRVTGGDTTSRLEYEASFLGGAISAVAPVQLEPNDRLRTPNAAELSYSLIVYARATDGLSFRATPGTCFFPELPAGTPVYLGSDRTPLVTPDLSLDTGGPCEPVVDSDGDGLSDDEELTLGTDPQIADTDGGGANDGVEVAAGTDPQNPDDDFPAANPCGPVGFDAGRDFGLFIWQDCSYSGSGSRWQVNITGGGSFFSTFAGSIKASVPITAVGDRVENGDVVDAQPGDSAIDFTLKAGGNGIDGFSFVLPESARACVGPVALPSGAEVRVGAAQQAMSGDFSLNTLRPENCDGDFAPVNTAPVLSLVGPSRLTVGVGRSFTDPGATALDAEDGDLSHLVAVEGAVDTSVPGVYTLTYRVEDTLGLSAPPQERQVEVLSTANAPPVIRLVAQPLLLEFNARIDGAEDLGASAFDGEDGDLSAVLTAQHSIDTRVPGSYTVLFEVLDSDGLAAVPALGTVVVRDAAPMSRADAFRFLQRATFGPTETDLAELLALGYDGWIDDQLAQPASPRLPALRTRMAAAGLPLESHLFDDAQFQLTRYLFGDALHQAIVDGSDQLRQRVAFALSQILVVSMQGDQVGPRIQGLASYHDVLLEHALGNYRDLLEAVTKHPTMGTYLSMLRNEKADPVANISPDENYAREILQLFSVGLDELNLDGTPVLDASGRAIPSYSQREILEFARVFTGWTYAGAPDFRSNAHSPQSERVAMAPVEAFHDTGQKTLFDGAVSPEGLSAQADLELAMDNIFAHPNVGPFISKQLIQFLVTSNPSPSYVARVAQVFNSNYQGVRGDLAAVVRAILTDTEALLGHLDAPTVFGKLKEPVLRYTQIWRAFDATGAVQNRLRFSELGFLLGQEIYNAPSVFNFFQPDHSHPGVIRDQGLVSPELQIVDAFTSANMNNELRMLALSLPTPSNGLAANKNRIFLDLGSAIALVSNPEQMVRHLESRLLTTPLPDSKRDRIVAYVNTLPPANPAGKAKEALYLIVSTPEYAVQR